MLKRIIAPLCLTLLVSLAYADNEGKKQKSAGDKESEDVIELDSSLQKDVDHIDDTLVFEDWDDSESYGSDNSYIRPSGTIGVGGTNLLKHKQGSAAVTSQPAVELKCTFTVYPNPVAHTLFIRSEQQATEVRVMNLKGETVSAQNSSDSVDVSSLEAGIYFVQMIFDGHVETKKFIKRS